jgi:voltage-gated potassium channel
VFEFKINFNDTLRFRIIIASVLLVVVFVMGTIGYHYIEEMSFFQGFYMTFITITTIGFGELEELSTQGRMFTIFIALFGIGIIAYIASQTTQMLLQLQVFKERVIQNRIKKMENHYIICGYGRIGRRIAKVLKDADLPLVIIEQKRSIINEIDAEGFPYVEGDAQNEDILNQAGTGRARALICTLSRDQDNVFVTLVARDINRDLFILVRTNQQQNIKKIYRAGADKVISPYEIGADRMANAILRPNVDAFMDKLYKDEQEDHVFEEIKLGEDSRIAGMTLAEAHIRKEYMVVIVAIINEADQEMIFNPAGDHRLVNEDTLIVLGPPENIMKLRTEACKDDRPPTSRPLSYSFLKQSTS